VRPMYRDLFITCIRKLWLRLDLETLHFVKINAIKISIFGMAPIESVNFYSEKINQVSQIMV